MIFRLVIFVFLLLVVLSWLFSMRLPWLEKMGLTKFNSSLDFRLFGRAFHLPVTIAVALVLVLVWLTKTMVERVF